MSVDRLVMDFLLIDIQVDLSNVIRIYRLINLYLSGKW